jgi:hypothetical protein
VSNVNLSAPKETRANLVIVPVGSDGAVTLSTSVGLDLVVDVAGWFTDQSAPQGKSGMYVPLPAARVTDTRLVGATPAAFSTTVVQVAGKAGVPAGEIAAVAINVTATQPRVPGFVSVFPHGVGRPVASTTNTTRDNQTTMSLALTGIGVGGNIDVYTQGGADVVADVSGYFIAAPS